MNFYGSLSVFPRLPMKIKGLKQLAYNLWWSWNQEAEDLFKMIDAKKWKESGRNPVSFLSKVDYQRLQKVSQQQAFINKYNQVMNHFNDYLQQEETWFKDNAPISIEEDNVIAYFSTEFGFHDSLPIYSGGLGVLAGDHCKSASDLGLPFVGIGLLYHNGYFKQKINGEGWQESLYPELHFSQLPITPVKDELGEELTINVKLLDREVMVKVWEVKVGRVSIYLLDTNLQENSKDDRKITAQLYGGDQETRILQEIILGVGGTKALYKMEYSPIVWHMNEGHSVYLELERIRKLIKEEELSFNQAIEVVGANTVFTTHTPVPAGNETFPFDLKEKYFASYWEDIGLTKEEFMDLGQIYEDDDEFCLTVLGLKLAKFSNGVSKLHGKIASKMWQDIWEEVPPNENPITYITNGIHTRTWLASEWEELFDEYLPANWRMKIKDRNIWENIREIPNDKFWHTHRKLKSKMIDNIRKRDLERKRRYQDITAVKDILDKGALTIGFARRFATYKRATLVFNNLERLNKICNKTDKEVQLVFAGKAHPADKPGKKLIKKIHDIAESKEFKGKIVLLEDYDMNLARYLIQGVDVWLNNPRRPLEASGTSGQKSAINGGLNLSIFDGWWCEGYNEKNGWVIGSKERLKYTDKEEQDLIDSNSLYTLLEEMIVPLYYNTNDKDLPADWINWMKEAMISIIPKYSTDRMVQEYTKRLYMPATIKGIKAKKDNYNISKNLVSWKEKLKNNWEDIEITSQNQGEQGTFNITDMIRFTVKVSLGELSPDDIQIELYLVTENGKEKIDIISMDLKKELENNKYVYSTDIKLKEIGSYKYTFRIVPNEDRLTNKHELGLVKWIK
ncbi:alpha-glucan family phosphorylase [Selenihalanaerobacter shriftii]|uniref:Maltodextrin phosphorylase n=1 Tax=Selenihalanaerobacter shriftii TaxID=142842 RepID=A0A1T4LD99_9FIRM|nr:alpha-glucan family phosphorylase [Selenihalanaerobacter shriftii]SJZ52601.1 maltodextrin phosphorylase [Selenihalanaerobacter shriftii]